MADATPKSYHTDPQLYMYTSLTSGSSQIVTATSRLQTILKANKITFQALDIATDEKARMLWGRRAGKRKLPGLVRYGMIIGDLEQVEEWNEYGELKQNLSDSKSTASSSTPSASMPNTPSKPPAPTPAANIIASSPSTAPSSIAITNPQSPKPQSSQPDPAASLADAMRQVGFEAAKQAGDKKTKAINELFGAVRVADADLSKRDHSGPPDMPPPSGTTEASEARKPETGDATAESKAHDAPATRMDDKRALEAEEAAGNIGSSPQPQEVVGQKLDGSKSDIPSAGEADKKTNEAIAKDEDEALEGPGQAEEREPEVPTAKEIEEQANQAIVDDETDHLRVEGSGSVPHAQSPEPRKKKDDEAGETEQEGKPKLAPVSPNEGNKEDEIASETTKRQEAKVGLTTQPSKLENDTEDAPANAEKDASDTNLGTTASRQEAKVGVSSLVNEPTNAANRDAHAMNNGGKAADTASGAPGDNDAKATMTSVTGIPQALPGSKMQDQPAAEGKKVGESAED